MKKQIIISDKNTIMTISKSTACGIGDDLFDYLKENNFFDEAFDNNATSTEEYKQLRYFMEAMTMQEKMEFLANIFQTTAEHWG
jgi:hypothetical protein